MDIVTYVKSAIALLTAEIDDASKASQSAIADHAAAQGQAIADLRARIEALESAVGDTSQLLPISQPRPGQNEPSVVRFQPAAQRAEAGGNSGPDRISEPET